MIFVEGKFKINCKYQTIRTKNYNKFLYCRNPDLKCKIDYSKCKNCTLKEYKEQKSIPNKKKTRTIATSIPKSVKEKVWERDNHKCIFCHKNVPVECACCHEIRRSQGGLGIEENIFTACNECHRKHDEGENQLEMQKKARRYLASKYSNWNIENLIYKKYKEDIK